MTHIVFISPETKDSRVQMTELADDIYISQTQEHYFHTDIAEVPVDYDVKYAADKLEALLKTFGSEPVIIVAYEDYAFVAIKALADLKLVPKGLLIVNFPLANIELLTWQDKQFLQTSFGGNSKGQLICFQADSMIMHIREYLFKQKITAEMVRMEEITKEALLNSAIFAQVKRLIAA